MKIKYYENDLPEKLDLGSNIAIDTETMGLNPRRDRLCLIQLSFGDNICHLIQIFDKFNNKFFPRDTVDQIKYKKGSIIKKKFKKGDIIFWKGHVAVCIDSKKLIHAYGPEKKVIIMPIHKTIKRIERTAKLKVKKVFRI